MARKKQRGSQPQRIPQAVLEALQRGLTLRDRGRPVEALGVVREAVGKYPAQRELLLLLAELTHTVHDASGHLDACDRLVRLGGADADVLYQRATALLGCGFPVLALRTLQETLARFPDHPMSARARQTAADLQEDVDRLVADLGASGQEGIDLGVQHERVQLHLQRGELEQARQVGERLLTRWPRFVPALNNIAEAWFHDGETLQAVDATRRALAIEPGNTHAQANLVRFLTLAGDLDAARHEAVRLRELPVERPENWVKKAEAFALLGDDQGVIDAWRGAEQGGFALFPRSLALLHHLAAVAFWRQGDHDQPGKLWRLSLEQMPDFDLAREHLEEMHLAPAEQNLPWPFALNHWLPKKLFERLINPITRLKGQSNERIAAELQRVLERHPQLGTLMAMLLDRGDPAGRGFAIRLALMVRTPDLLAALRDFALSQRGTDEMRLRAATAASEAGLLDPGRVRMWGRGQWSEVVLTNFEVSTQPRQLSHSSEVNDLAVKAIELNHEGRGKEAESLLRRALELEPGARDVLFNLSASLMLQGRQAEGEAIIRELYEKDPDYLFARTGMARLLVSEGKLDEATALLTPLLRRRTLHLSEMIALTIVQVELALARNLPEGARGWVALLDQVAADHPMVRALRERIERHGGK
jgi:tetratricopeptide (TPR) repeat protein